MIEKVIYLANSLRMTVPTLFMTLYEAKYGTSGDVSNDVVLFNMLGVAPEYVLEFIEKAEKNENSNHPT